MKENIEIIPVFGNLFVILPQIELNYANYL